MTYDEAFKLEPGDKVTIIKTGKQRTIKAMEGTLYYIFVILDDGYTYKQSQVTG